MQIESDNHKPQAYAKMCNENNEENKEKKQLPIIFYTQKRSSLAGDSKSR